MKSGESFLRKVSVYILTDLNPGFGGPWKQLFFVKYREFLPYANSLMWFFKTITKIFLMRFYWLFSNFEFVHEIQKRFGQKTSIEALWKCHIQKIFIKCSRVGQIQDLGQSKYKLRFFSKRTHGISKNLFFRVPMNP